MVTKKVFMRCLGERIRYARQQAGMTQEQLAECLNLSRGCIARYELGEIEPRVQNLAEIALTLHVSTDYLLGISNHNSKGNINLSLKAWKILEDLVEEIKNQENES